MPKYEEVVSIILIIQLMKQKFKRSATLPEVISNHASYLSKLCEQVTNNKILIDQGYGDKNIALFRTRARKKLIKEVPTAFTSEIRQLLECRIDNSTDIIIANAHNEAIERIINRPKGEYNLGHKDEQKIAQKRQQKISQKYKKGFDTELRQYNQHLSFGYLPAYQQAHWFRIKDNSKEYQPLPFILPNTPAILVKEHSKAIKTQRKTKLMHLTPSKLK